MPTRASVKELRQKVGGAASPEAVARDRRERDNALRRRTRPADVWVGADRLRVKRENDAVDVVMQDEPDPSQPEGGWQDGSGVAEPTRPDAEGDPWSVRVPCRRGRAPRAAPFAPRSDHELEAADG